MSIDFDPTVDHYKALGVASSASAADIKKAFRKLAKANHPDSTGGDKKKEVRFKEVSSAYEILGDAKKRAQYDEVREQLRHMPPGFDPRTGGFDPRAAGFDPRRGGAPGGPQVWDLSDLFAQFAGAGGGQVHIDSDAWSPFGGGNGPRRGNRGERRRGARAAAPEPVLESRVRASDGTWLTVKGADVHSDLRLPFQDAILGTVRELATLDGTSSMKIPPGTSSGQKLRLRGKGVIARTGESGDHYVTVHIDVPRDLDDESRRKLVDLVDHLKSRKK